MSANYQIIEGPRISEGLLSQNADASRNFANDIGTAVDQAIYEKKRRQAEKKAWETSIEQNKQNLVEGALANTPQQDEHWLMKDIEDQTKKYADFAKSLPRNEWFGAKSLAMQNAIKNDLANKKKGIQNYWANYEAGKELHKKDVNFNLPAFEMAHLENMKKEPTQRSLDLNDPRFYNQMTTVSNHLMKHASKELQPFAYQEKSKVEPSVLNTMETKFNPSFYEIKNGKVQVKPVETFEPLAQTLFEQNPHMARFISESNPLIHDLATGENTSGENPTGHKDAVTANRLAIRIAGNMLQAQAAHDYSPGFPSLRSSTHIPEAKGETLSKVEKAANAHYDRVKRETEEIAKGNTKAIDDLKSFAKSKGFDIEAIPVDKSVQDAYMATHPNGKKLAPIIKFTTTVDQVVQNPENPNEKIVTKVPHTQEYNPNDFAQRQALMDDLSKLRGGSTEMLDLVSNRIAEDQNKETVPVVTQTTGSKKTVKPQKNKEQIAVKKETVKENEPLKNSYSVGNKSYTLNELKGMGYSENQIKEAIRLGNLK